MQYDWAIFILIRALDRDWPEAERMLRVLLETRKGGQVAVMVCINTLRERIPSGWPRASMLDRGETTLFYELGPDGAWRFWKEEAMNPKSKYCVGVWLKQAKQRCPAHRYLLFTWDHGSPVSLFDESSDENTYPGFASTQRAKREWEAGGKPFRDEDYPTALLMTELGEAIAWGMERVDVVVMMNCYAQSIDAGLALSSSVDWLVAPETDIRMSGYDYASMFACWMGNPSLDTEAFARVVIDGCYEKQEMERTAVFANRLVYYPKLVEAIDRLSWYILERGNEWLGQMRNLRWRLPEIETGNPQIGAVDLFQCMDWLKSCRRDEGLWRHSEAVQELIREAVRYEFVGAYFNKDMPVHPSGMSIYFPGNKGIYYTAYKRVFQSGDSPFAGKLAANSWMELLDKING